MKIIMKMIKKDVKLKFSFFLCQNAKLVKFSCHVNVLIFFCVTFWEKLLQS